MKRPLVSPGLVFSCFSLVLAGAACSEPAGDPPTQSALKGCLEVRTWTDDNNAKDYTRKTWDDDRRILVSESSSSASFDKISTLKWRYASGGRIVAYIGVEQPFQHDYRYDEHDNVTEFRLSYPQEANLDTPSTAPTSYGTLYVNEYTADGRLSASTISSLAGSSSSPTYRRVFTEDAAGRCAKIDGSPSGSEILAYDSAGRLHSRAVSSNGASFSTSYEYDGEGRVLLEAHSSSGVPFSGTFSVTHEYLDDGSERVTLDDQQTDVLSERHITTTRTAACLAIDAAIGRAPDARCRSMD